ASKLVNFSIAGGATPTGTLNLNDNDLVVDYTGTSPLATIASQIAAGYAGGTWAGPGINSGSAAAVAADSSNVHKTALGYAEAGDVFTSFPATFSGQSIDNTAVLLLYTAAGDADLSHTVDTIDFNLLTGSFAQSGKRWHDGDCNYSGTVDTIDFNLLATNFGYNV